MAPNVQAGTVFAGHRIHELIGRGGMGVVYRATQVSLDDVVGNWLTLGAWAWSSPASGFRRARPPVADRACKGPLSRQTSNGSRRASEWYSISPGASALVSLRAKTVLRREPATKRGRRKGLLLELRSRSSDTVDGTPNAELLRVLAPPRPPEAAGRAGGP